MLGGWTNLRDPTVGRSTGANGRKLDFWCVYLTGTLVVAGVRGRKSSAPLVFGCSHACHLPEYSRKIRRVTEPRCVGGLCDCHLRFCEKVPGLGNPVLKQEMLERRTLFAPEGATEFRGTDVTQVRKCVAR
jgi:hypothetical protein